jgi:hypothetical protein
MRLDSVKPGLSCSFTLYEDQLMNRVKESRRGKNSVEVTASGRDEEG